MSENQASFCAGTRHLRQEHAARKLPGQRHRQTAILALLGDQRAIFDSSLFRSARPLALERDLMKLQRAVVDSSRLFFDSVLRTRRAELATREKLREQHDANNSHSGAKRPCRPLRRSSQTS